MLLSRLTVDRRVLDRDLSVLGLLVWVSLGTGMDAYFRCPLSVMFMIALYVPGCRLSERTGWGSSSVVS